jgi:hypothetical protein
MPPRSLRRLRKPAVFLSVIALTLLLSNTGHAIPAFARQYGTSCSTCHIDFPKLNDFGKAFKDAGFKFPKDDAAMLKIPPVMLGAPANAELWPKAIWPGTIPGIPPIGLRYNNYFQYTSTNRSNFSRLTPAGTVPPFIPATDFQTGFFSIFTAGNFGSDIAFWVDDDISVSGANANGGLGEAYLKFVNLGRLMKLPPYALSLRVGQLELDIPFTQAKSIWISPYDIYTQANVGAVNPAFPLQQFVNNTFTFAGSGKGVELSGGRSTGGYHYSLAFIDQNTSGTAQANNNNYVPTATGGNFGGVGVASDSNFKDIYTNFQYRFNLERDKESRNAIQAAGPSGPRDHTYLNVGTYWLYGRSVQRLSGATPNGLPTVVTAREPFYRVGGNFTFNYHNLQFNGLYMYGHDYNLLPIDANGFLVPLPVSGTPPPVGFIHSRPATFSGGFVDVEWLAYPWMMVLLRYDGVNSTSDYVNALVPGGFSGSPFNGAASATRNRITPGVQFLIHANIKTSFEYQFRPSQSVVIGTNPITGFPVAMNPFHTNTAVVGLEFVY